MRYGHRSNRATSTEQVYTASRTEGFGAEVKRRIMLGTFVLSAGYYDAYYGSAQRVRRLIRERTRAAFETFDVIVTPTAASTAFRVGEKTADPIKMYLSDIFTVQAPLAGLPAISIPLGLHSDGLPFGIQLMADSFNESTLLATSAHLVQSDTVSHVSVP
jgi:aspartyl-tRNA(Asn)/glutamyl-tRNA(Gln) amidotransferase subunit A